jgi:lipoyl(octanoyl) transferase
MRQWRLLYDPPMLGADNMATDDAILQSVIAGKSLPTLRFYSWSPPCLSLGYGQKETDVDFARLQARGWEVVRRPTGGRAILHTDELTYSVTLPADHPLAKMEIVESYRRISEALMKGLERIGAQPHSERASKESLRNAGAVCFEIPSHYEITVDGRKLIGSAQTRRRGGVLQHGSLPLEGDLARICDALAYDREIERDAARVKVHERALTLEKALGRRIDWDTAADAICEGFQEVFEIEFQMGDLSDEEKQDAHILSKTRYASIARMKSVEMS